MVWQWYFETREFHVNPKSTYIVDLLEGKVLYSIANEAIVAVTEEVFALWQIVEFLGS